MPKEISLLQNDAGECLFIFWHDASARWGRPIVIDNLGRVQQLVWFRVEAKFGFAPGSVTGRVGRKHPPLYTTTNL